MSTLLPLYKLVDLAVGTPEIGAVNFNVLHSLLHAMLKQLNIQDVKTDIEIIDQEFLATGRLSDAEADSMFSTTEPSPVSSAKSIRTSPPYHFLEKRVNDITKRLEELNQLPSNEDLFENSKTEGTRAVADMWQNMQLKKRVDANETGIGKLMSMMEDLIKDQRLLKDANSQMEGKIKDLDLKSLMDRLAGMESFMNDLNDQMSQLPSNEDLANLFVTWPGLEDALNGVRDEFGNLQLPKMVSETNTDDQRQPGSIPSSVPSSSPSSRPSSSKMRPSSRTTISRLSNASSAGPSSTLLNCLEQLGTLNNEHTSLVVRVVTLEEEMKNKLDKGALNDLKISDDVLEQLKMLQEELESIQGRREKDEDIMRQFQESILQLQAEDEKLQNTTQEIIDNANNLNELLQSLQEHVDRLEETKADKEYVAMEVDVKADKKQLDKKVNKHLFESTTNEINKIIQEILSKLTGSEDAWKDALKALENDIDGKLDRLELDSIKNWLESRLKALNKKIVQNSGEWIDDDAAGLRKQLLLKFNCLSCDRPVDIMPAGAVPSLPCQNAMPATKSPRPYTTYELDNIRQHAKNFHGFSNTDIDYYASVRQCGGGHTLTYPHKRTSRTTHIGPFFREDMTEPKTSPVMQKGEVDVQGVDGQIYKGRSERMSLEAKMRLGTSQYPKPPSSQNSQNGHVRPLSARGPRTPRPLSGKRNVRPQSAYAGSSTHSKESSPPNTPRPLETDVIQVDVPRTDRSQEVVE